MNFLQDYHQIEELFFNQRPYRLPLYEHHIVSPFILKVLGENHSSEGLNSSEFEDYFRKVIGFWSCMVIFRLRIPTRIRY